jgi:hypothetical protein
MLAGCSFTGPNVGRVWLYRPECWPGVALQARMLAGCSFIAFSPWVTVLEEHCPDRYAHFIVCYMPVKRFIRDL